MISLKASSEGMGESPGDSYVMVWYGAGEQRASLMRSIWGTPRRKGEGSIAAPYNNQSNFYPETEYAG
jgi:hypothetical protein